VLIFREVAQKMAINFKGYILPHPIYCTTCFVFLTFSAFATDKAIFARYISTNRGAGRQVHCGSNVLIRVASCNCYLLTFSYLHCVEQQVQRED